jgi:hypothetical protein
MLMGLVAVAIPPIIHLLNRRRYEVIDWGAMQFLQISEVTRRRLLIEELLLMLMRMGLIAVLVLALADPFSDNSILSAGQRTNRDVVLVVDGSASMSFKSVDGKSAHDMAQEWAKDFLGELAPGDGVAVIVARKQPVLMVPKLSRDLEKVRDQIHRLPEPGGSADMARAVQAAYGILDSSERSERDVIVLGDGQRFGWADQRSVLGWEDLAGKRDSATEIKPKLWAVNLDPHRPSKPSNWALAPLVASRAVVAANQDVTFRTAILLSGPTKYEPPHEIRVEVDGKKAMTIEPPKDAKLEGGQVPLRFELKLPKVGSHLVSVIVEPDPPRELRKPGYIVKDQLPVDNRRDFAVEVLPALPVLIIDGEEKKELSTRASDFLRDALSPARDQTPAVKARVVSANEFTPAMLREDTGNPKEAESKPRVVILNNVPKLNPLQTGALETFLSEGGGILVAPGERVDADWYNSNLHRDGEGWLPARLSRVEGDESNLTKAAKPLRESFNHPALEMFRKPGIGSIDFAWFARWWRLSQPLNEDKGVVIAKLDRQEHPFFIEGKRGDGRIIVSAVPLDNSWRTNLIDLRGYVPLLHELVFYLAAVRAGEHNLEPGQPLRHRLASEAGQQGLMLQAPSDREAKPLVVGAEDEEKQYSAHLAAQAQGPLLIHEGLTETGVWKLTTPEKETVYYVVQPDAREADLTPFDDADREKVGKFLPFAYENDVNDLVKGLSQDSKRQYFWWWFLVGVIVLLCGEVWMTRKIVKSRA